MGVKVASRGCAALAVDLGTASTRLHLPGRGVVVDQPSVVALAADGRPLAVGADAKLMVGRVPRHIEIVRPLRHGVVADLDVCERMLRYLVQSIHKRRLSRPRMVVCVPSGITGVEQRAVQEAAEAAGARRPVHLVESAMAAAIGVGLPVHQATGSMVVVAGAGTTEVAVISLGGVVASQSVRVGGDELDEAIATYARRRYSLVLGERTAEEIKLVMGSAAPLEREFEAEIRGRDLVSGLPKTVVTSTQAVREALEEPVAVFVEAVKGALDATPPELAADVMEQGIALAGGGALLPGLDQRLANETGMPVVITGNPLHAVVRGAAHCLGRVDAGLASGRR
jgi:rod shape-determining protein MreB